MGQASDGSERPVVLTRWCIHIQRWQRSLSVKSWSYEARGLYVELALEQMLNGVASGDKERWRRATRPFMRDFDEAWAMVCERFAPVEGGLADPLIAADREEAIAQIRAASAAGRNAVNARWDKARARQADFTRDTPVSPPHAAVPHADTSYSGSGSSSKTESPGDESSGAGDWRVPAPGERRALSLAWCAAFQRAKGVKYGWTPADDERAGALLRVLDLNELEARMPGYLDHPVFGAGADFAGFASKHNVAAGSSRDAFQVARERAQRPQEA